MSFTFNLVVTGAGTFFSRLLGFARDASIAWLLGAGAMADVFSLALRLPYVVRRLLGEGSLSLGLTTVCVSRGQKGAGRLALAVLWQIALLLAPVVAAGVFFAPELVDLLSPGIEPWIRPDAVLFFRLCLPYIWLAALSAACMAGLHARDHFILPGLSPSVFNCVLLTGAALSALYRLSPREAALLLAIAVPVAGLAQFTLQFPMLHTLARSETDAPPREAVVHSLRALPAGLLATAVPQIAFVLACIPASLLGEGHLSSLFYAERLLEFPLGLTAAALGMSTTPVLAAAVAKGPRAMSRNTSAAIGLALCLSLPATAGLAAVGSPLVRLLFAHGAFSTHASELTTLYLYAVLPCLPAYAVLRPLITACHTAPLRFSLVSCSLVSLGITLGTGFFFTVQMDLTAGPALGIDAGLLMQTGLLWLIVSRRFPLRPSWHTIALVTAASLAVYGVAAVPAFTLDSPLLSLGLAVPAGLIAFISLIWPARNDIRGMAKILHQSSLQGGS